MNKKLLAIILSIACVLACALGLVACDFGDGDGKVSEYTYVTYHYNGGYRDGNPELTADMRTSVITNQRHQFKPMTSVDRDTWLFDGWYFDEHFQEAFTSARFVELTEGGKESHLYAKWVDTVTVTEDNFTTYFSVSSQWNGNLNVGNAAISYEFEPKMAFDPAHSADQIEISVTPILSNNGQAVWRGETQSIYLTNDEDYCYSGRYNVDSSAVGVQFQLYGKTLEWELVTESFELKLLHDVFAEPESVVA